jgi:putative transposase
VQAVVALKADFRLDMLLEIAGLARSTFFYQQARLARPDPHAAVDAAIRTAFTQAKGRYGHRRIHRELGKTGHRIAKKTVLSRMRRLGLACQVRRKKRFAAYRGTRDTTVANTLNRVFTASAPNQKWVSDVTEFRIGEEKCYLSPVLDLFDRQIIAYTVGRAPNLDLATSALRQALATLPPGDQPLVHTDQGFQYQHRVWRRLLADAGAIPSMSRKGNCLDNAVIESFFGHLKSELFAGTRFASLDALEPELHAYIRWYNHERTSATLNGLSPVQYRAQTLIG